MMVAHDSSSIIQEYPNVTFKERMAQRITVSGPRWDQITRESKVKVRIDKHVKQ